VAVACAGSTSAVTTSKRRFRFARPVRESMLELAAGQEFSWRAQRSNSPTKVKITSRTKLFEWRLAETTPRARISGSRPPCPRPLQGISMALYHHRRRNHWREIAS